MKTVRSVDSVVVVLSLILGLAGCGGDSSAPASDVSGDLADQMEEGDQSVDDLVATDSTDGVGEDSLEEIDAGNSPDEFPPEVQKALQNIMDDYIAFSGDPGFAFAFHKGDDMWYAGYAGYAELATQRPVDETTQFRVGSNTKPMTAAWILMLVEEGKVELDESITTYLPQYPQWKEITVRHLLGMQSGLPEFLNGPTTLLTVLSNPGIDLKPADVLDFIKDMPVLFAPGQGCSYSNTDYTLLGMIGEAATGKRAADELRERIFEPLGMKDTYLEMTGDPTDRLAHGYMDLQILIPMMKLPALIVSLFPKELFVDGTMVVDASTLLPPSLTWTAGSGVSVPRDLAIFQRALQSGRLLKPETMAEMRKFTVCNLLGGTVPYGLGVMANDSPIGPVFGHGGLNFGFHVETYYSEEKDIAFCHMHNFLPAQVVNVSDEAVETAYAMKSDVPETCIVPDELFEELPEEASYIKMIFKGPVGDGTDQTAKAGAGSAWVDIGKGESRLYGFDRLGIFSGASRYNSFGTDVLSLSAFGPADKSNENVRWLTASFPAASLEGVAAGGYATIDLSSSLKPYPALVELALTPEGFQWTSECIVAVADPAFEAKAYLCDGADYAQPGKTLRMGLAVAMTADIAAIEARLSAAGIDRCRCFDETNQPISCPE